MTSCDREIYHVVRTDGGACMLQVLLRGEQPWFVRRPGGKARAAGPPGGPDEWSFSPARMNRRLMLPWGQHREVTHPEATLSLFW